MMIYSALTVVGRNGSPTWLRGRVAVRSDAESCMGQDAIMTVGDGRIDEAG